MIIKFQEIQEIREIKLRNLNDFLVILYQDFWKMVSGIVDWMIN